MLQLWCQIPGGEIKQQTLYMQLFDWDRMSKNDPLGEVKLNLAYFDLSNAKTEWRQLQKYSGKVRMKIDKMRYYEHHYLQPKPIDMSHPSIPSSQHSVSSLPRQVTVSSFYPKFMAIIIDFI